MRVLVAYYSHAGSNRYLAERTAGALEADIEEIRPVIGLYPLILPGTWLGIGTGLKKPRHDLNEYHRVVIIAPLYLGKFALPAQILIRRYSDRMNEIICATCCGSTQEKRNEKFGYQGAFRHIRKLARERSFTARPFHSTGDS